jgi:PAS domain S-box-containing protein
MPTPRPEEAIVWVDRSGRYTDANGVALDLLGVTLEELIASEPDRFAIDPSNEADQAALRAQWERAGVRPLVGTAGLKRANGETIRVSFAIEPVESGLRARLAPIHGSPAAPATVFSVGDVLREWRAAERELAELTPGTPAWTRTLAEVQLLRERYQELFRAAEARSGD